MPSNNNLTTTTTLTAVESKIPQQTFILMKTSWRRLSSSSSGDVSKTSSRRLDQEEYIRLSHTSSEENFFKTSCSRPIYSFWSYVFKTSSKPLQDILQNRFQNIFKASCKDVFKTFSRGIIKFNCSC